MIKDALQYLIERCKPEVREVGGRTYVISGERGALEIMPPAPSVVELETLQGICDLIEFDNLEEAAVHVVSPVEVRVVGVLGETWNERWTFARASPCVSVVPSAGWRCLSQEEFINVMLSCFVPTERVSEVVRLAGSIKDARVTTLEDDGVTQQVTASAGIARVAPVSVPNPVSLQPYRTFPEIEQPESSFVLRMSSGAKDGALPSISLLPVADSMWRSVAISRIAEWFAVALPNTPVIR